MSEPHKNPGRLVRVVCFFLGHDVVEDNSPHLAFLEYEVIRCQRCRQWGPKRDELFGEPIKRSE